jgi:protein-tyrosine phosphatase
MNTSHDPTKINLQTNVKADSDPTLVRMAGVATHGNTPFDVPFMSHIEGNLWQGGCQNGLQLPHFIKHIVSLYPWEQYKVKHDLKSSLSVVMYDSLDQSTEQVNAIADWVYQCTKDGPTLVHCQAGLNRSSLVAAKVLMRMGSEGRGYRSAKQAIEILRKQRSDACLCNPAFEEYLLGL